MQEKERGFLLVNRYSSDMIFGLRSQGEIGSGFCYLGFVITSWLKRLPLWKIWKRKQNLFYFLWEHTVFVPSDVKNRAGSITYSPYSIRPLTPRCCFFKNIATDLLSHLPKLFSALFLPLLPSASWHFWCLCSMALLNFFYSVYSELNFLFRINHSISDTRQLLKQTGPKLQTK